MMKTNDPALAALDVWRVVFHEPELERRYRSTEFVRTLWLYRWAVGLSALIHVNYLVIDYFVLGQQASLMWLVRLSILVPASLLVLLATYRSWYGQYELWFTIALFILNGMAMSLGSVIFGIETIMYFVPGTIMVAMYSYILMGTYFWITTGLCLALVIFHSAVISMLNVPAALYANAVEAMLVSLCILVIGGHRSAMTSRIAFLVSGLVAKQEGAKVERQRIMRDLHDDVAGKLLALSHRIKEPDHATLAREALASLRQVIYELDEQKTIFLEDFLTELQVQLRERTRDHAIEIDWKDPEFIPAVNLQPQIQTNMQRVLSEAASNAIRHCKPTVITVSASVQNNTLILRISNNGDVTRKEEWHPGKGLNNIGHRMRELGGQANWSVTNENPEDAIRKCCLELILPLPIGRSE